MLARPLIGTWPMERWISTCTMHILVVGVRRAQASDKLLRSFEWNRTQISAIDMIAMALCSLSVGRFRLRIRRCVPTDVSKAPAAVAVQRITDSWAHGSPTVIRPHKIKPEKNAEETPNRHRVRRTTADTRHTRIPTNPLMLIARLT